MPIPEDSNLDYSRVNKIALIGGIIISCKMGSYREYTPGVGKKEVFECEAGGNKIVGLSDHIIAMWFSQDVDN